MPSRSSLLMPLAVLALALVVLFHRLLLGEVFFWGLPALQFVPWREHAFDLLRGGSLPLWNGDNGAGAPLLANYQSQLLYPFTWITYPFYLVNALPWVMSIIAVLHLVIAGWGMGRLAARLGFTPLGQGMSALAFGLTGYLVARLGTYPIISAAAWLPWLCWAVLGLMHKGRPRDGAWLALFTALTLLAGHAQTAWYSLLLAGLFALWAALRLTQGRRTALIRLTAAALCIILGAGIAALQLLPTTELLRSSPRAEGVDYDFAMNFSYELPRSLNLLSANVFGTPADGSYVAQGYYFEYAVYVGLIPLVSALMAVAGWLARRRDRPAYFAAVPLLLLIVVTGFVFALGRHSPVFPFLYRNLPTFDLFQAPVRWHLWTVFGLSLLAGIGVGTWGRGVRLRRWTRRLMAACAAAVLVPTAAFLAVTVDSEAVTALLRAVFHTGVIGLLAGALTLAQPPGESRRTPRWLLAVFTVAAFDLVWANWGLNPTVPAAFFEPQATDVTGRAYWPEAVEQQVKFETFFPDDDYRIAVERWPEVRASNLPNLNLLDGVPLLNNFDPLLVGQFAAFLTLADDSDAALRAAGVSAVYETDGSRRPLEVPGQMARLVDAICWHEDEAALRQALLNAGEAHIHSLGDGGCPPASAESIGTIRIEGDTLHVNAERDAWLYVAQTDYPGWTAAVDGEAAYIYRANLAFRAVQVSAGEHVVTFVYRPAWLLPGALITLVALLIVVVLLRIKTPTMKA